MKKPSFLGLSIFFIILLIGTELAGYYLTFLFPNAFATKNNYLRPQNKVTIYHEKYGYLDDEIDFKEGRHRIKKTLGGAAFGGSFTFGDEVYADETWTFKLTEITNLGFRNYGSRSWGFDQALLYYEDIADTLPSGSYIFLGIIEDHLQRIRSIYRKACSPSSGIYLTKPRFVIHNDTLILKPNPISKKAEISKLENWATLKSIVENDECFKKRKQKWGQLHEFPYSITLYKALKYTIEGRTFAKREYLDNDTKEIKQLSFKIINKFKEISEKNSHKLILLLYPEDNRLDDFCFSNSDVLVKNDYENLMENIAVKLDVKIIDLNQHFAKREFCLNRKLYYEKRFHLSPLSHKKVSEILAQDFFGIDSK